MDQFDIDEIELDGPSKYIEKYVTDEDVVIRQEAQKALKRLKI